MEKATPITEAMNMVAGPPHQCSTPNATEATSTTAQRDFSRSLRNVMA